MWKSPDVIILARALLAGVVGFAVGWEREAHGHAAGTRTIALLTIGVAVLTALSTEALPGAGGERLTANIITGIGFLGAGLILHRTRGGPRGLTTAATIWAMTSVGVVIGTGHELLGVALTLVVLLLLWWRWLPLLRHLHPPSPQRNAHTRASSREESPDLDL